jgi:hypothetical protein
VTQEKGLLGGGKAEKDFVKALSSLFEKSFGYF